MVQTVKNLPATRETQIRSLHQEDPLKKKMATHSSTLWGQHYPNTNISQREILLYKEGKSQMNSPHEHKCKNPQQSTSSQTSNHNHKRATDVWNNQLQAHKNTREEGAKDPCQCQTRDQDKMQKTVMKVKIPLSSQAGKTIWNISHSFKKAEREVRSIIFAYYHKLNEKSSETRNSISGH